ncbi:site-specific DNA-methyltransferase [Mesorhizobium sp. B2-2-4]|uniref:DNA-methyltransferase n=1 Tax=unclassified Mesorhizobium TaxID=325217 RepID=UPI00112D9F9E|nr:MULTISPECIES: DNA methyltransferase [unclassified Mesorhizobium]TPM55327.1 site-specific DNA-methyltransferase [Mesorhizobium sp. B2-2-4]TPM66294.1 site-specific DNA-methyltransferase [Mesorhizobium sp. B2-2-1]TPN59925.1 site-specific DNA-methyltransferase [Mesorhizobium sp. B1-1-3]
MNAIRREEIIGDCRLILGDCLQVLPLLAGGMAVVSDPPYGMSFNTDSRRYTGGKRKIGRGEGRNDRQIVNDDRPFDPAPWLNAKETILWGANHYASRLPVGQTLIWLKKHPEHYGSFLSDAEIGWQSGGHGVFAIHAPDSNGRRRSELTGSPFGTETGHPTQKPIALMVWCVERTKSGTVLDPYMGSGTTGVACVKLGRKFIGIEIDETYFDIACERIRKAYAQPDMFVEPRAPDPKQEALEL